jgi:hypothetical protein
MALEPPEEEPMSDERPPAIDEIVGLLRRHAPDVVERFRQTYPQHDDLFAAGVWAGETEAQKRIRAEVALAGLNRAIEVCAAWLPKLRQRLERARQWQFAGQLAAIVGGASIFGTATLATPVGSYIAASVTLAGSLASAYAHHLQTALQGRAGGVFDSYRLFVESELEARQIKDELSRLMEEGLINDAAKLVRKANAVCFRINKEEAKV